MNATSMETTARALVASGKGILAADESFPTIEKRFRAIGLPSTEANRQAYREMLFSTPGIGQFLSGTILFDETIRQKDSHGTPLVQVLQNQGIIPGIKVDQGTTPLALFPGENVTQGLDGLRERLAEYHGLGAQFTKWRAVFTVADTLPTAGCIRANSHALARFAALSQEADLVPIVEPEVLMNGSHSMQRCEEVTEAVLYYVFEALYEQRVAMEKMLLKANMIVAGLEAVPARVDEVALTTVRCLRRTVPAVVPGIVFLSGGQDEITATKHLHAMTKVGPQPWELSFSFGRALQDSAMHAWAGQNVQAGQDALYRRARLNSLARFGRYASEMESEDVTARHAAEEMLRQVAA